MLPKISHQLSRFIQSMIQYKVHHVLFWFAYLVFWMVAYNSFYTDKWMLTKVTSIYAFSHMSIFYFSQYVLVPRFYRQNKSLVFLIIFLTACILMGFVMYGLMELTLKVSLIEVFKAGFFQVLFVFVSSNIFVSGILLAIKSFRENRKVLQKSELIEKERLQTELQFLKSQVNPHFLFNTINSIYVLIKIDPDRASDTLIKLSNLLRAQLYEFNTEKISIQREIEYIQNYLALEKTRKGDRVTITVEKEGDLEGFSIAPLILIPFLENCFKHLSNHTQQENLVHVRLSRKANQLHVRFYNTREEQMNPQPVSGGLGLVNIRRRLDLLYQNQHTLTIEQGNAFYEVNLQVDIWP